MKRLFLMAAVVSSLFFTACSSDDDSSDDNSQDCFLCTIVVEFGDIVESSESEICDNGDGTITVIDEEGTQVVDLEEQGVSFEEFIEAFEFLGTCEEI